MGSRQRRRRRTMGRWILGIGCMLVSAGAFAAVIYFSNAGREDTGIKTGEKTEEDAKKQDSEELETEKSIVDEKLEELTLEDKIAQMFMITPDALTGVEGTWNPGEVTEEAFKERPVGGLIMMEDNLVSAEQIQVWNDTLTGFSKETVGVEPFLAVEEEGGTVSRIAEKAAFGIENVGNMSEIGSSGDTQKAYDAGKTIGSYLKELGFNMDLAPVAGLWTDAVNTDMHYRSFGSDPNLVSDMVSEAVKGLRSQGIYTTAKYFPAQVETDENKLSLQDTEEELKESEFLPFQAAIEAGTEFIMIGHCSLPNILEDDTPASMSKEVIEGMLRTDLEFDRVVITAAMDQAAITARFSASEAAVQAVQAGADILLMPEDFEDAYQGVLRAVKSGTITEARIDQSVKRILEVKLEESGEDVS